jgi:hypothetical protein
MAAGALAAFAAPAIAQDAAAAPEFASAAETAFIFNTLLFLIGGFLVMWMAAGFAMLEAGLVRSKNVSMQCLKNIALYSIAGLMFWVIGYSLMYTDVNGGYFGTPLPYSWPDAGTANEGDYSVASDWFFQMVFCAATASIVSGTLAERIKLWPFLIFTAILTGVLYPITGSWQWGGGWLSEAGFSDFAGSTIVHSVGGWAALAGAIILGARKGKYGCGRQGQPDAGFEHAACHARHVHPVARLVRLQRRIAAGHGLEWRRVRHQPDLRQHQPGCLWRRGCSDDPDPDHVQEGRRHHGAQRRTGRPGLDHRRTAEPFPLLGHRSSVLSVA